MRESNREVDPVGDGIWDWSRFGVTTNLTGTIRIYGHGTRVATFRMPWIANLPVSKRVADSVSAELVRNEHSIDRTTSWSFGGLLLEAPRCRYLGFQRAPRRYERARQVR